MNEQQIRKIVQDEMMRNYRSGAPMVPPHQHNGVDNLKIDKQNLTGNKINTGSITLSSATTYKIAVNFIPTSIWVYGNVVNDAGTVKAMVIGNALLGGAYYSAPSTSTSVSVANTIQNIAQSSIYFSVDTSGSPFAFHTLAGQTHIIDVQYPKGTTHARVTVDSITGSGVVLNVENLDATWKINANFVIT